MSAPRDVYDVAMTSESPGVQSVIVIREIQRKRKTFYRATFPAASGDLRGHVEANRREVVEDVVAAIAEKYGYTVVQEAADA